MGAVGAAAALRLVEGESLEGPATLEVRGGAGIATTKGVREGGIEQWVGEGVVREKTGAEEQGKEEILSWLLHTSKTTQGARDRTGAGGGRSLSSNDETSLPVRFLRRGDQ